MAMSDDIETERLLIRKFRLGDAAAFLPLVSLPDVLRYTGEQALASADKAGELLKERQLRDYDLYGYGRMACIEKSSGRLVGLSGLKYLDDLGETDLGYRFLPEAWGKGYATESAAAILDAQASRFGLTRTIGLVEPDNRASVRVLQKLGLAYEKRRTVDGHGELDQYAVHSRSEGR